MDEAGVEDQRSDQNLGSGLEAEVQSAKGNVDHEQQQQQRQELEEWPSDMDQEANTSDHHEEQQVSSLYFSHDALYLFKGQRMLLN